MILSVAADGVIDRQIRAGVHTGEIEQRDGDVGGIAVHIATRVMAAATPGEILTSSTVHDLMVGFDIAMTDRGPIRSRASRAAGSCSRPAHDGVQAAEGRRYQGPTWMTVGDASRRGASRSFCCRYT
jgi:class 3 adenylate cyclase